MTDFLATPEDKLDPRRSAVLVVDVQNDFAHPDGFAGQAGAQLEAAHAAVDRLVSIVDEARRLGVPVIHVRAHYDDAFTGGPMAERLARRSGPGPGQRCVSGTWGADFYKVVPAEGEYVINKHRYSGFIGTDLEMILHKNGIETLVVGGLTTDVCVESTVRDAFHRDFYVIVLSDGTATPNAQSHEASLGIMGRMFGDLMTTDQVVDVWEHSLARVER